VQGFEFHGYWFDRSGTAVRPGSCSMPPTLLARADEVIE
jgi:hypothetical protein